MLDIALLFAVLFPLGHLVQYALDLEPSGATGQGVYVILVLNFSLPAWAYFALADHSRGGATFGKRLFSLGTKAEGGGRVSAGRALVRTAVKLVPWEIVHASAFLFAPVPGEFGVGNWVGIGVSYVLLLVYLLVAWRTGGRRSVHDFVASTCVTMSHRVDGRA